MILSEQHQITKSSPLYKVLDRCCFLSKNLYNAGLYVIKQEFLKTGRWIRYYELNRLLKDSVDYRALSSASSQQVLMLLDKNVKSYFHSIKSWKRDKLKFLGCPKFPKYKHKTEGRNVLSYTYQQVSVKGNFIHFPKKEGIPPLRTKVSNESIKQVRIVPRHWGYQVEVLYEVADVKPLDSFRGSMGIDLGVNNLAACGTDRSDLSPLLINGRPLKSINQYYNKKLAKLKSDLERNHGNKRSHRISRLTRKRNNKIKDYMHKSSKYIVSYCKANEIDRIVVGKNDGWKQEVNLGRRNNQNFVGIPFEMFIGMLKYKSERQGLTFIEVDESYTSDCSSLDLESIGKHETYVGKRIKRGLFRTGSGSLINADVNAALNILRNGTPDAVMPGSIGFVANPVKVHLNECMQV